MSDPTPFPVDPQEPENADPDLIKDADEGEASTHANDPEEPGASTPEYQERMQERAEDRLRSRGLDDLP